MAGTLVRQGHLVAAAVVFGGVVNLLMLTGPLYMLHLYDHVLATGSVATLVTLSVLAAFLFAGMAVLDYLRGRIMGRVAGRFSQGMAPRVFDATMTASPPRSADAGPAHLEALRATLASPALLAVFDLPWTVLFILVLTMFHPALGLLAGAGVTLMAAISITGHLLLRSRFAQARQATAEVTQQGADLTGAGQSLQALGQLAAHRSAWVNALAQAARMGGGLADRAAVFTALTVYLRHTLHAGMLGLGAYLVLLGQLSPGAMIAAAILLGRVIAPVELVLGQLRPLLAARAAWQHLDRLLTAADRNARAAPLPLPAPTQSVEIAQLTVFPPGSTQASLRMLGLRLGAGQALGVAGPSGAGKTTLARVLTGALDPSAGTVLFDEIPRRHYPPKVLEAAIGYLPQQPLYPPGTVAQTIAGPQGEGTTTPEVIAAATLADAHRLILTLPEGYATPVATAQALLSAGQMHRIALARAFFGPRTLVVLDAADALLDQAGLATLAHAVAHLKSRGTMVIAFSQRAEALGSCDQIIHLRDGMRQAVGPVAPAQTGAPRPSAMAGPA
ncbi:type I secretion system permease/ATPase [Yoonia sp.]|uniref:type I secretion system permease/ATPase n=1 Tax=Yoonia sp. TaxID=2212373 RepID=UPI002FDA5E54